MKHVSRIILFSLLQTMTPVCASDFSGNVKTYPILRVPAVGKKIYSWQNSAKLQYNHAFFKDVKTEVAYELTSVVARHNPHPTAFAVPAYRYDDLKSILHDEQNPEHYASNLTQNLNRLNISYSGTVADVTLGRQPIAFGSAKSINPTDVLTPFSITSIDKEDRTGVDAINVKSPINATSLIEAGFVAGEKLKSINSAFYIRPKFNFNNFDLALTAMNFKKRKLYGLDLQHPLLDAGAWLEVGAVDEVNPAFKDYLRLTTGLEYKFQNSLYLAGEYHYNGASLSDLRINPSEFIFLKNFHYAIATATYEITPLTIGSIQSYYNWRDHSFFSLIKVEYNLSENSYVGLGTFAGVGNKSTTEFGRYGKTYFSSIRYYY